MQETDTSKIIKSMVAVPLCLALGGILYGVVAWGWIDTGIPLGVVAFVVIMTVSFYAWVLNQIWRPKKNG